MSSGDANSIRWQITHPANAHNQTPSYRVEHDTAKADKRTGKVKRATKHFADKAEAEAFVLRMRDEGKNPRATVVYVHGPAPKE